MILSIVILSYNTPDLVINCIKSLQKQYEKELLDDKFEIIVVDNASEREAVERIEKFVDGKKNIKLIKNNENAGFGRGCNLGSENSNGKYVVFLNSDTQVLDKGFLEMISFMDQNLKVGILGGKLLNDDGSIQESVGKFYNLFNFFVMLMGGEKFGLLRSSPKEIKKVDWVSGACMMVSKKLFDDLGKFDKNIFMYVEDMELAYRANKKGVLTYFFPDVSVKHITHGSSNKTFAIVNIYKGILYFYSKHKSKIEYLIVKASLWLKAVSIYLLGRISNNSYYTKTYGQALEVFK